MSHWIMGVFSALVGLADQFMAGAAPGSGILVFGPALALFCSWMIKTAYDEEESDASR